MLYVRFPLSLRNVEDLLHDRVSMSATKPFTMVRAVLRRILL